MKHGEVGWHVQGYTAMFTANYNPQPSLFGIHSSVWGWGLMYFMLPNLIYKGWVSTKIGVIEELENWKRHWGFTFWIRYLQDHRKWNPVCLVLQYLDLLTQCWSQPRVLGFQFSLQCCSLCFLFLWYAVFFVSYRTAQRWQKSPCWQCRV